MVLFLGIEHAVGKKTFELQSKLRLVGQLCVKGGLMISPLVEVLHFSPQPPQLAL